MEIKHSVKFLRQRKLMIMLPLLVLPFITMAFWALGGGSSADKDVRPDAAGLNLQLPTSSVGDDGKEDKLTFYKEAEADSLKKEEFMRNDPYYRDSMIRRLSQLNPSQHGGEEGNGLPAPASYGYYNNTAIDETKINQQIDALDRQIRQPNSIAPYRKSQPPAVGDEQFSKDVSRMEDMMQMVSGQTDADPEMQQLDGTLEKILDIQHPQRVQERLKERSASHREVVFPVSLSPQTNNISLLDTGRTKEQQADKFYGVEVNNATNDDNNSAEAVVHDNQTLVNGAVIRLRLTTDIYVSGSLISNGSFVYGTVSLNGERLEVNINSVRNGNSIFPVKLQVYDLDGMPGIYIPGAITRDVAKQSADNATQSVAFSSLDPSIGAQAAGAGIEAAKSLLSKKVKLVKVEVKAGYRIILKDNNQQQ